jgi:MFS family permease
MTRVFGRFAACLAIAVTLVTAYYGPRAVGGADEYGYASQADLWLKGRLTIDQSFVRQVPWNYSERTFAPLGYHPHPGDRGQLVPTYSPGFPILLALGKSIGGQDALFFVVPLAAGLLVLATYCIGRRLGSPQVGALGAWFVATSPTVLFMSMATMSDVPVATAWSWAFYLLLGGSTISAVGAGLLSSLAILIRPNLAPLAAVLAMHYVFQLRDRDRRRFALVNLIAFLIAVAPGVAAIAIINDRLHGSAFTSGYGELAELFALSRVPTNLLLYLRWLAEAHTAVALLGLAAVFVPWRRIRPPLQSTSLSIVIALFVAVLWAIYAAWLVFDVWWFTRFLLSSWPFIMLALAGVVVAAYRASPGYLRSMIAIGVIGLAIYQVTFTHAFGAFNARDGRRRFVAAARVVRNFTDRNSVIISQDHNGSIRYYGGRTTMDYEWLPRGKTLDDSIVWLKEHGVRTYVAVEAWEMDNVRRRLAGSHALAALDAPPVAIYEEPGRMLLFDLTEPRPPQAKPSIERDTDIGWRAAPPVPLARLQIRD